MPKLEITTLATEEKNEAYVHIVEQLEGESILTCVQNALEAAVLLYNFDGLVSINIIFDADEAEGS